MATTSKKSSATKSATTKKSTATPKKNAAMQQVVNTETKVVCPVCGTEFDVLAKHEHQENVTMLGMDSGLGTIVLPVSKRGEALASAGIDTSKYFSIKLPTGGEQMMMMDGDGRAVPVSADDPIIRTILSHGTVPNRSLFRRWVMSQVFHGLQSKGGFTEWINHHGYRYQWEQTIEELRVQARLYGRDMENFHARNRWFHKLLAVKMAEDYIEKLKKDALSRKTHRCKGVPYVSVEHVNYFVSDIDKKLLWPMRSLVSDISRAKTPEQLYQAVRAFWKAAPVKYCSYDQCPAWKDAYKGAGAYFTMQNLLRFHGCTFPRSNSFYSHRISSLDCLEQAATAYSSEGWRLFGLLKQCLDENHIDINAKMKQWAMRKSA